MTGELHHGDGPRPVATGGFAFDEATMRSLIKEWLALADSYFASIRRADNMTRVQGPGLDFASTSMAAAANRSGAAYQAYLQHNFQYCSNQAQLFQNALDDYLGIEHTNVIDINKTGPDGPQDGV